MKCTLSTKRNGTKSQFSNNAIKLTAASFGNMLLPRKVVRRVNDTAWFNGATKVLRRLKTKRLQQQQEVLKRMRIGAQQDYGNCDTFHRAIKPYLFVAHIFGVLPLVNTLNSNPFRVRFQVQSLATLITFIFFVCGGLKVLHFTIGAFKIGLNEKNIVTVVFFYTNLTICLNFLLLARRWPQLIQYWTRVETTFLLPPYESIKFALHKKLKLIALSFWVFVLVEHSMFYASSFHNYRMGQLQCNSSFTTFRDYLERQQFADIFAYLPYNVFLASFAFFLNANFNFIWNFLDLFIMLVSLALAMRFQQFAARVKTLSGRFVPDAVWYEIRQHHIQLCELMEYVDERLSTIVLISSLNNMYFICNQLLNIFTKLRWPINYAYFWISLIFLISRTIGVFMCAAEINDASLLPLKTLYLVPRGCWTEETQRFTAQITNEFIGLTGKRLYFVTRRNLFGLAATIVTYEFMLLQFDANSEHENLSVLCG